jgi:DNA polymerase-3 subunit alpha
VGEEATRSIVRERKENGPFADIFDFCTRLDTRMVNKKCIESLNRAGAYQSTGWNRRQVESILDQALAEGQTARRDRDAGQTSLFDMDGMTDSVDTMHVKPDIMEWPEHELLQYEKEMLGLYVSSHPLQKFADLLRRYNTLDLAHFEDLKEGQRVNIGGMISGVKIYVTSKNAKMAFLTLETLEGNCEVTVFSDIFEQKSGLLVQDMIVMIDAKVSYRNDAPGLLANEVLPIEETEKRLSRAVHIRLGVEGLAHDKAVELGAAIDARKGSCDVFLHVPTSTGKEAIIHATDACRAAATPALRAAIESMPWVEEVYFSAGHGLPTHQQRQEAPPEQPRWKKRKAAANA